MVLAAPRPVFWYVTRELGSSDSSEGSRLTAHLRFLSIIAQPLPMEIIHQAPTSSSFTPLAVHQSQTPESFYSGPPILYHHSPSASLYLHASDLAAAPALSGLANGAHRSANGTAAVAVNGHDAAEEEIAGVDVWVTSECEISPSLPFRPNLYTYIRFPTYKHVSLIHTFISTGVSYSTPPPSQPASQSLTPPSPSMPSSALPTPNPPPCSYSSSPKRRLSMTMILILQSL